MSTKNRNSSNEVKKILDDCLKQPGNRLCAECGSKQPRWASTNLGIFVCIRCSGIHRNLGVHISKVKSVSLDAWPLELAEHIQSLGNEIVNASYEATLPSGRKPTEETGNYETENFIRDKYVNKKWYRNESESKRKTKKGSKKPAKQDSGSESGSGSSSDSEPEEKPRKREEEKPRKRDEKKKPRSKKGKPQRDSTSKPRADRSERSEKPEKVSERASVEKHRSDSKPQQPGIFGADFDAQFRKLEVSGGGGARDQQEDSKFGEYTEFQSSQKATMAKSSDFESFFSDPPSNNSAPVAKPAAAQAQSQALDTHDSVSVNKPAKDAIMALFAQPQTPRGYSGFEMQQMQQMPQMPPQYPAFAAAPGYAQYPGYAAAPGYPMGMAMPGMAAPSPMMAYQQQPYARASSSFGYQPAAYMAPAQPIAFGAPMAVASTRQAPAQGNAFEGLF